MSATTVSCSLTCLRATGHLVNDRLGFHLCAPVMIESCTVFSLLFCVHLHDYKLTRTFFLALQPQQMPTRPTQPTILELQLCLGSPTLTLAST